MSAGHADNQVRLEVEVYPFSSQQPYPRNRWYIAAFSREIGAKPFERVIMDTPVALYRTAQGKAIAMYGICPHRYFPLAQGTVKGDVLICPYHGFNFASDGRCVQIPSQRTGANFVQPTYPLEERGTLTWIWMGDPAKADPDLIPPYEDFGLDRPDWGISGFDLFEINARPQILIDNLMDLSHFPFVHNHIDSDNLLLRAKQTSRERPRSFQLRYAARGPWTPFFSFLWGDKDRFDGDAEFFSITDFYGPEFVRTSLTMVADETGEHVDQRFGELYFLHGVTPRTPTSAHYFALQTRNFRIDDTAFGEALGAADKTIRLQDVATLEAVERRLEQSAAAQRELVVRFDRPQIEVRRRIQSMLEAEQAETVPA